MNQGGATGIDAEDLEGGTGSGTNQGGATGGATGSGMNDVEGGTGSGTNETVACLKEMKTLLKDLTTKVEKNCKCLQELEQSNERYRCTVCT